MVSVQQQAASLCGTIRHRGRTSMYERFLFTHLWITGSEYHIRTFKIDINLLVQGILNIDTCNDTKSHILEFGFDGLHRLTQISSRQRFGESKLRLSKGRKRRRGSKPSNGTPWAKLSLSAGKGDDWSPQEARVCHGHNANTTLYDYECYVKQEISENKARNPVRVHSSPD
jgi:hypothetical protein